MVNTAGIHLFSRGYIQCWYLTWTEVVVFEHVALQAAAGGKVLGAVGHGTAGPQAAGVLLMLLGVNVQTASG